MPAGKEQAESSAANVRIFILAVRPGPGVKGIDPDRRMGAERCGRTARLRRTCVIAAFLDPLQRSEHERYTHPVYISPGGGGTGRAGNSICAVKTWAPKVTGFGGVGISRVRSQADSMVTNAAPSNSRTQPAEQL